MFRVGKDICRRCDAYLPPRQGIDNTAFCIKVNDNIDHFLFANPGGKIDAIFWLEGGDNDAKCYYHIEQLVKYNQESTEYDDDRNQLHRRNKNYRK